MIVKAFVLFLFNRVSWDCLSMLFVGGPPRRPGKMPYIPDSHDDDDDDDDDEEPLDLRLCNVCGARSFIRKGLCANARCLDLSLQTCSHVILSPVQEVGSSRDGTPP